MILKNYILKLSTLNNNFTPLPFFEPKNLNLSLLEMREFNELIKRRLISSLNLSFLFY